MSSRPFPPVWAPMAVLAAVGAACSYQARTPAAVDTATGDARPDVRVADAGPADGEPGMDGAASDGPAGAPPDAGLPVGDAARSEAPVDTIAAETAPAEAMPAPTPEQIAFGCPPDPDLRGCWTFDEPNAMTDGSGRGNHMVRNTAQWVNEGVRGGTLRFTTGRQFAVVPDAPSLRLAGTEATFEAWIRPTSSAADGGADTIASKFTSGFTGWSFCGYDHQARLYVTGNTNQAAGTFEDNRWTHVAVVLSKAGVNIYLDGVRANAMPLPPLTMTANEESVTIGGLDPANIGTTPPERFAFHGDIDVLRIYSRPRRPDEICAASGRAFMAGMCRPGSAAAP